MHQNGIDSISIAIINVVHRLENSEPEPEPKPGSKTLSLSLTLDLNPGA